MTPAERIAELELERRHTIVDYRPASPAAPKRGVTWVPYVIWEDPEVIMQRRRDMLREMAPRRMRK